MSLLEITAKPNKDGCPAMAKDMRFHIENFGTHLSNVAAVEITCKPNNPVKVNLTLNPHTINVKARMPLTQEERFLLEKAARIVGETAAKQVDPYTKDDYLGLESAINQWLEESGNLTVAKGAHCETGSTS